MTTQKKTRSHPKIIPRNTAQVSEFQVWFDPRYLLLGVEQDEQVVIFLTSLFINTRPVANGE